LSSARVPRHLALSNVHSAGKNRHMKRQMTKKRTDAGQQCTLTSVGSGAKAVSSSDRR
jgi:hypothetical protein